MLKTKETPFVTVFVNMFLKKVNVQFNTQYIMKISLDWAISICSLTFSYYTAVYEGVCIPPLIV